MPGSDRPQGVSPACSTDHFAELVSEKWNMDKYREMGQISTYGHLAYTPVLTQQPSNVARMGTFGVPGMSKRSCTFDSVSPRYRPEGGLGRPIGGVSKGSISV